MRLLPDPTENPTDTLAERDPALAALFRSAMLGHRSDGKDAGKPQRVEFGKGALAIKPKGNNCVQSLGFSLHANTTVAPLARDSLEKLCKYICRPAIAESRLRRDAPGELARLKIG